MTVHLTNTLRTSPRISDLSSISYSNSPRTRRHRHAESTCRSSLTLRRAQTALRSGSTRHIRAFRFRTSTLSSPIAIQNQPRLDSQTAQAPSSTATGRVVADKSRRRSPVSQDSKPQAKESEGLLRRVFGLGKHETVGPDAHSGSGARTTLDLGDIQGFILRGYRMPMVRHFLLAVGVPAEARKLLERLVSGDESDAPQITTAEEWQVGFEPGLGDNVAEVSRHKPDYCLNLGITWQGLIALEIKDRVPTLSFKSFGAFTAGAAERAKLVGDTGPSDSQNWIGGFGKGSDH